MTNIKDIQIQLRYVVRLLNNPLIFSNDQMRIYALEIFSDTHYKLEVLCKELNKLENSNDCK